MEKTTMQKLKEMAEEAFDISSSNYIDEGDLVDLAHECAMEVTPTILKDLAELLRDNPNFLHEPRITDSELDYVLHNGADYVFYNAYEGVKKHLCDKNNLNYYYRLEE